MARVAGQLKSSANAGQLAQSLLGKVNLKQYYSGAKRMLGFEPIPQSGFSLLPGSRLAGLAAAVPVVQTTLTVSSSLSYTLFFMAGQVEIWRQDLVKVATVAVPQITAQILPEIEFYGEANTVGIFHPSIWNGIRLLRNAANDALWTVSAWPFQFIPDVDLGGDYAKTDDVWEIYFRWGSGVDNVVVSLTVEGSTTAAVSMGAAPGSGDWGAFANSMRAAIAALPGFVSGVSVSDLGGSSTFHRIQVRFSGILQGAEYDLDASIVNTSEMSALATHSSIGETSGEPLISSARGGFSGMTNYQDRSIYIAPKAKPAAIGMSRIGEYFDLNIESQSENAARLEALRTEVSETALYALDATYLVVFTDRAEYFASNRTVERGKPLNWVRASAIGTKKGCKPVLMDSTIYFVSRDGGRLYSASYDAVSEAFQPSPVNDLNNDIVSDIGRMIVQRKSGNMSGDRLWLLREDGRLICCAANVSQDIRLAACEWPVAGNGFVRGISVDGLDRVWITVDRNGVYSRELLVEQEDSLFQTTVSTTTDLAGAVAGLAMFEGKTVWAEIDDDIHGPFVVSSGSFQTDVAGRPAIVGVWTAPIYESMPYVRVLPNDDVVRRPGKVVSARLYLEDAASIAVGANGRVAREVPLQLANDNLDAQKQNFTGHRTVAGLIGVCMDPTLTITQVRPGRLRVRDYIAGVKL
ncbi:hypothetical protein DXT96_07350 [Agrobacterium sp. ICMP 6402]|uniref:hypothetical protein n=1 Tax=Agrobacterium sp. ICMP 6402 TaxID=2292443 RepID=UPI0012966C49|nr:hypothetical protein [Agrobacterium sp. ICMP 6402]MQB09669.1 hypothetical protein [Agrobacterium sp. ICMP 6402]